MYKAEITTMINKNIELGSKAATLIKKFNKTSDIEYLNQTEAIHEEIRKNHMKIENLRRN